MPTYMLEGAAQVSLTARPLTVSIRLEGTTIEARLDAVSAGALVETVVRPRPDMLIIPRVAATTTVRVVAAGTDRFPAGTIAHASVAVAAVLDGDPERAVLIPIDLAGLASRDLFVFDAGTGSVLVRAARVLAPPADLGQLGNAARIMATEILGVQGVDDLVAVNVVAAVDGSASFGGLIDDGSAEAVLHVIAGVAEVIAPMMALGAARVGTDVTQVSVTGSASLATAALTAVAGSRPSSALASATPTLLGFAPTSNTVTYLITDSVPADIDAFAATNDVAGEARHLVVLGTASAWQLQDRPDTPSTLVEVDARRLALAARLLAEPAALRTLVASLLIGCFTPGTDAFKRVER